MKNTAFYSLLIHGIEKLYHKIAVIVLHKRMNRSHKPASQGVKSYGNDIKSPLLDFIDNVLVNDPDDSTTLSDNDIPTLNTTTNLKSPAKNPTGKPQIADKSNTEESSRQFKARTNGSELYPEIVNKLKQSIWDHIHATVRYARQGDKSTATMHTDIANSACKELAHHMDEEHYQAFIMTIAEHMNSLKPDQKEPVK